MSDFFELCEQEIVKALSPTIPLTESINDAAIFKAVFMAGVPGAGKTYVSRKISDGAIQPRIVNTDKFVEFLAKRRDIDLRVLNAIDDVFLEKNKELTLTQFAFYINSMLPLWIDGTSQSHVRTFRRMNIIESFGYDVYMVWIDTDLDTAIERVMARDRNVPEEFIRTTFENLQRNKQFFKSKLGRNFIIVDNNEGMLTDNAILSAYRKASKFYREPLRNLIGKEIIEELIASGEKYLAPTVVPLSEIKSKLSGWYQ